MRQENPESSHNIMRNIETIPGRILKNYMKEWDELDLDLIITPASLMPAPLKVS